MTAKRSVFRFSLRSVLVVIFIVAALLSLAAWQIGEGRRHQQIGLRLESLRCSVDYSPDGRKRSANTTLAKGSTLPDLARNLQLAATVRIEKVTLRSQEADKLQRALSLLSDLGSVSSVSFHETGVSEKLLATLLRDVAIEHLYVSSEKLPRTRMPWLNSDGMRWLCVSRTQFSNPAIEDLPLSLTYFDATRTRINDEGLKSFTRMTNLKTLKLRRTPTSSEAIELLRKKMPWCKIDWQPLLNP